jgi:transposase
MQRYSSEFKGEALLLASGKGITAKAVCAELGISTRQFKRWRDEPALLGKDAFPGSGHTRDNEVAALKRELARVEKERVY